MKREYNLERINAYREFKTLNRIRLPKEDDFTVFDGVSDPIQAEIFAPDPETGFPRSDIALMLNKDTAPEIRQYIQDNILRAIPGTADFGSDDASADLALQMVKTRHESLVQYSNRLRDIVASSVPKNEVADN